MNSSRGFCVEWVASVIVLVGTIIGLPLSTTHCKVGGVIGAGLVQGLVETNSPKMALKYVNFKVLIGVLLSWVLTVPASMGLSSVIFLILKKIML
jgi:phosphate/sulfate permease